MCVSKKTSKQTIEQDVWKIAANPEIYWSHFTPPIFPPTHSVKGSELSGDDAPRDEDEHLFQVPFI